MRRAPRPLVIGFLLLVAAATATGGLGTLWVHAAEPAPAGTAPSQWPAASTIPRPGDRPTLVMFAHPRCPCTRGSLDELRRVLAPLGDRIDAQLWVVVPDGVPAAWAERDELVSAATIPGVALHFDVGGAEARRFDARASGQVVLYDAAGRLRYHGGVTGSRGHAGANAGADRLAAQLAITVPVALAAPVFGCALLSGDDR